MVKAEPPKGGRRAAKGSGLGRRLGTELREWLTSARPERLRSSSALTNRLMDGLGNDDTLRGPLRDLASRPLLLQALQGQGTSRQAALEDLSEQLRRTYTPEVLAELLDLLEAATDIQLPAGAETAAPPTASSHAPVGKSDGGEQQLPTRANRSWTQTLRAIAPGVALASCNALVLAWCGQELDRGVFDGWGWSGGVVLVIVLALIQGLSNGPLPQLQDGWRLNAQQAVQARDAWRWLKAPWIHQRRAEAIVNLLLLLLFLGNSPLPLRDVILRYSLVGVATLAPAVSLACRWRLRRVWSGGSGAVSGLVSLAAGLSLLRWEPLLIDAKLFQVPAWVVFVVYGALQLNWQLLSTDDECNGSSWQRLLCSQWTWGLVLGSSWAVLTWAEQAIRP